MISFCIDEDNPGLNGEEEPVWVRLAPLREGDGMAEDCRLGEDFCWSSERGGLLEMTLSLESSCGGSGIGSGVICCKERKW